MLNDLTLKPENEEDRFAVAVVTHVDDIVGHVPYTILRIYGGPEGSLVCATA